MFKNDEDRHGYSLSRDIFATGVNCANNKTKLGNSKDIPHLLVAE